MFKNKKVSVEFPDGYGRQFDNLVGILMQIYGELNRIRLILGEKSETGRKIVKFDERENGYNPFFDSGKNFMKFKSFKNKRDY